jgi:hypothetical protein
MDLKQGCPDLSVPIVEDMATQQTTLRGQLQMLEISEVDTANTAEDALRLIKARTHGVLMCDDNLSCDLDAADECCGRPIEATDTGVSERVRAYLTRLDGLMPGSDRVAQMHRCYLGTLAPLRAATAPAAVAA